MNQFLSMGLIGFGAVLVCNLITWLLMHRTGAAFFSDEWWSVWFVNYLVWLVFVIIGAANRARHPGAH